MTDRTHVVDKFSPDLGCTVRDCLGCGCLVPGGPTRCVRCANAGPSEPPEEEEKEKDDLSVMVRVDGKSFRCEDCGANCFTRQEGRYHCNRCDAVYIGEPAERSRT